MYKYNIRAYACHGQLSHIMVLIETSCRNSYKFTNQQRENIASLQELCNIRHNALYSDLQIHEINDPINDIYINICV